MGQLRTIAWGCVVCLGLTASSDAALPNIVLLIADDLGYGELGCQGNPQIPTPHIDSLARGGVRCTSGYVVAPYCSSSRAGLMTGRYPTRFGYEFNPVGAQNEHPLVGIPPSEVTLAEQLRAAGYVTGLIGKWHLGGHAAFHPLRHGFDEFFGFTHEGHFYVPPPYAGVTTMLRRRTLPGGGQGRWSTSDGQRIYSTHMGHDEPAYDANNPILRDGQPVAEQQYLTDALTREAVSFIDRNSDSPFFLCVAYNAVHSPLQGAQADMERVDHIEDIHRRIFAAMLLSLDDSVGTILSELRQRELEETTLIFFLSDNGGPTRELTSSNRPLRGGKGQLYEGGVRIPFLLQWKGVLPAGATYGAPVTSLDIFATAAKSAAAAPPRNRTLDGVDLLPFLSGQRSDRPHGTLYWRLNHRAAIRVGDWKLVRHSRQDDAGCWELYDLAHDISETHDMASDRPEKVAELLAEWQTLDDQMAQPIWQPGE